MYTNDYIGGILIKIIDCDLGKDLNIKEEKDKDKVLICSPGYCSPEKVCVLSPRYKKFSSEQLIEEAIQDNPGKQDIYALGVILFELLFNCNIHMIVGAYELFNPKQKQVFNFTLHEHFKYKNLWSYFSKIYSEKSEKYKRCIDYIDYMNELARELGEVPLDKDDIFEKLFNNLRKKIFDKNTISGH